MSKLTILGSTGSIGRQTLEVAEHLGFEIAALTAYGNATLLKEQAFRFNVKTAVLGSGPGGADAVNEVARNSGADIIVVAIPGQAALAPTLAAVQTGCRIALASKEPLVCAGERVMQSAREHGTEIIPVDSEHSAIFQCLNGRSDVKRIILTASGGPFLGKRREELRSVTPEEALRHPNWSMGQKVTIDSATMMNKGLEVIEAMHLFNLTPEQIEVVIHPESIIHSMVEFADGSTLAQLSHPDMRMPIQYALTYPERVPGLTRPLDIAELGKLTFIKPDLEAFPCLQLAYDAARKGEAACAALNKANEEAVNMFLAGEIGFLEIAKVVSEALAKFLILNF